MVSLYLGDLLKMPIGLLVFYFLFWRSFVAQITFEEFKRKNEKYYKDMFAKYKKLLNTEVLYSNGKEITIEEAMLKAYKTECEFEQYVELPHKKVG